MNKFITKDHLCFGHMASGRRYIELTADVGWDEFPRYAEKFAQFFAGKIITRNNSVDILLWEITIQNELFHLVYEDFPTMISLESQSDGGDRFIRLLEIRT